MQNKNEEIKKNIQKLWLWSDCKLVLHRTNPLNSSQQSYESLQAQVQLQTEQIAEPFIPIIKFKKPFIYDYKISTFFWKKNRVLPQLQVKLQQSYFQLLKEDEEIIMIYCELTVAYPCRKETHIYLQQVQTIGQKRKPFSDSGQICFDDIRIKESSSQKYNSKFSIVLKICASSIQENRIILKTLISTAFSVDYNRIKRINRKIRYKFNLISPQRFMKPLRIEKNPYQNQQPHEKNHILNLLKDCTDQFKQISNVHPFYLLYQFGEFFRIYYNSAHIQTIEDILQINQINQGKNQKQKQGKKFQYKLTKTKIIQKNYPKRNMKKKTKCRIDLSFEQSNSKWESKILMIKFSNHLINKINRIISTQQEKDGQNLDQIRFEKQLQKEIYELKKILLRWKYLSVRIDLLNQESQQQEWKEIKKENVYHAYSKLYDCIKSRLGSTQNEQIADDIQSHNMEQTLI